MGPARFCRGVLLYRSEIEATSAALSASLRDLSAQLESLAPPPTAPIGQFPAPVPQRLELTENLKARSVQTNPAFLPITPARPSLGEAPCACNPPPPRPSRALTLLTPRRWNEKLLYGAYALRTTDWAEVASQGWAELQGLKDRLAPKAEAAAAAEGEVATRQV